MQGLDGEGVGRVQTLGRKHLRRLQAGAQHRGLIGRAEEQRNLGTTATGDRPFAKIGGVGGVRPQGAAVHIGNHVGRQVQLEDGGRAGREAQVELQPSRSRLGSGRPIVRRLVLARRFDQKRGVMPVEVADVGVGASGGLARRRVERRQARLTQRQVERRQRQQARPRGRVDHLPLERSGQAAVRQVGVVKGRDQPRRVLAPPPRGPPGSPASRTRRVAAGPADPGAPAPSPAPRRPASARHAAAGPDRAAPPGRRCVPG